MEKPGRRQASERAMSSAGSSSHLSRFDDKQPGQAQIGAVGGGAAMRIVAHQLGREARAPEPSQRADSMGGLPSAEGLGRECRVDVEERTDDGILERPDGARGAEDFQQNPESKKRIAHGQSVQEREEEDCAEESISPLGHVRAAVAACRERVR